MVIFLIYSLKTFPYIAILIGTTWGIYGLLRKKIDVSPEIGLFYESFFISLFIHIYNCGITTFQLVELSGFEITYLRLPLGFEITQVRLPSLT